MVPITASAIWAGVTTKPGPAWIRLFRSASLRIPVILGGPPREKSGSTLEAVSLLVTMIRVGLLHHLPVACPIARLALNMAREASL